jgi:hypothetical protein
MRGLSALRRAKSAGGRRQVRLDAPDDAVNMLAKSMLVPLLEKLLADGAIVEYEIDEQVVHSDAPGTFVIDYIAPTAEGLDKVNAAIRAAIKNSPLDGVAFASSLRPLGERRDRIHDIVYHVRVRVLLPAARRRIRE